MPEPIPHIRDDKYQATALGWSEFFGRQDFADVIREKGGVAVKARLGVGAAINC
jgi:hypothetical protein